MNYSDNEQLEDTRSLQIELATKMKKMLENEDFKTLFIDGYIEAYALTSLNNAWMFNGEARVRYVEQILARSYFTRYIDDIITQGNEAIQSIRDEQSGFLEEKK